MAAAAGYRCRYCGAPIAGSSGFMSAGDLVRHLAGEIEAPAIRITCPRCDLERDEDLRAFDQREEPS